MLTILGMLNPITAGTSSIIQSIQQVSITIANGATSNTATISAVTTANTMLVWNGVFSGTPVRPTDGLNDHCYCILTNDTTITATRTGSKSSLTVKVTAIEFKPTAISLIQTGSVALASGVVSANATITSAVMNNSLCHFNGQSFSVTANSTSNSTSENNFALISPTQVVAKRASDQGDNTSYFSIVQFSPGTLNSSTQQISITSTTSGSIDAAITSVAMANSVIFWGNFLASGATFAPAAQANISLKTATSAALISHVGPQIKNVTGTIVNFKPSNIININRGKISIPSGSTSATATITSAVAAKTSIFYLGIESSVGVGANPTNNVTQRAIDLTNPTTITTQIGASTTIQASTHYESIQFV